MLYPKVAFIAGAIVAVGSPSLFAAYPLAVDDADVVPPGEVEIVVAGAIEKAGRERAYSCPLLQISVGVADNLEMGLEGGYQYAESRTRGEARDRVDGFHDTILSAKRKWFDEKGRRPSLATELAIHFPTGSARKGLGSGNVDFGFLVSATRTWGGTALDVNAGYNLIGAFRSKHEDDTAFYGLALRRFVIESVELLGEVFAETPSNAFSDTALIFNSGLQWEFMDDLFFGVAAGAGLTSESPDYLATAGITRVF